jgi:flagellar basal body-associated protein FliL
MFPWVMREIVVMVLVLVLLVVVVVVVVVSIKKISHSKERNFHVSRLSSNKMIGYYYATLRYLTYHFDQ